jgi:hypothetical protein
MELHLQIIGYLFILLAFIHVVFPKKFEWKKECGSLSLINRQMMYIHTFFIALVVLLMGILCISSYSDLIETPLGQKISLGFFIFWVIRFFIQFFGYSSELWKGKKFETLVHVVFSIFWAYVSVVFFIVYWH